MQKVKVSVCGQHIYAEPAPSKLLFVLLHPPSAAMERRLRTIALDNGYNGHAVTWLCSARVESRRALLMRKGKETATGREHLHAAIDRGETLVAAWGLLPKDVPVPFPFHEMRKWLCMGRDAQGNPIPPKLGAKFVRY